MPVESFRRSLHRGRPPRGNCAIVASSQQVDSLPTPRRVGTRSWNLQWWCPQRRALEPSSWRSNPDEPSHPVHAPSQKPIQIYLGASALRNTDSSLDSSTEPEADSRCRPESKLESKADSGISPQHCIKSQHRAGQPPCPNLPRQLRLEVGDKAAGPSGSCRISPRLGDREGIRWVIRDGTRGNRDLRRPGEEVAWRSGGNTGKKRGCGRRTGLDLGEKSRGQGCLSDVRVIVMVVRVRSPTAGGRCRYRAKGSDLGLSEGLGCSEIGNLGP